MTEKHTEWYVVFTFKHLPEEGQIQVKKFVHDFVIGSGIEQGLLVLEHGSTNTNPHYNMICKLTQPCQNSNLRKKLIKAYKSYEQLVNEHTLHIKHAIDPNHLIKCYLQKENDYKIIYNKGYDLESIGKAAYIPFKNESEPSKLNTVKLFKDNAHIVMYEYAQRNSLEYKYTKKSFCQLLTHMVENGYSASMITGHLGYVYGALNAIDHKVQDLTNYFYRKLLKDLDDPNDWGQPPILIESDYEELNQIIENKNLTIEYKCHTESNQWEPGIVPAVQLDVVSMHQSQEH